MTTEIFENCILVRDINSIKELMSVDSSGIAAFVITTENEFQIDDADREYLSSCCYITMLYSNNLSSFSADFIMAFDIRLSENDYYITSENFKKLNINRYRLLCGETDTYQLISSLSSKKSADYKTRLIKHAGSIEDVKSYCQSLFKEKTSSEINCLLKCLTAARTGNLEAVFGQESVNFYEMVKQKVQGS